jgi:hypothetical protein
MRGRARLATPHLGYCAVSLVRKAMADSAVLSRETDLALNDMLATIDVRLFQQLCGFGV